MAYYDGGSEYGFVQTPTASNASGPKTMVQDGQVFQYDPAFDEWIRIGTAPSSGGSSSPDHFFDLSPTDTYNMGADQRDFDYKAAQDAADAAWKQKQFDYGVGQDAKDDAFRDKNLGMQDQWNNTGFAIDRERIAAQAQADAARTAAQLAGVAQQGQAAKYQYEVGMAGAANDAQRNQIQAAWNSTQAALAREEYALRDRLTTQQNQIAQFDAETKRAGTMGQLALDNNKFILEKSTSPRDLFGLFMMQRGINPDWAAMAAGQDPGTINPLVAQDPFATQFQTPAVNFGAQTQGQQPAPTPGGGGGGGGQPQPTPQPSLVPHQEPGLVLNQPTPTPQPQPNPQPTPAAADFMPAANRPWKVQGPGGNGIAMSDYEPAGRDFVRDPLPPDIGQAVPFTGGPMMDITRMASGGYTTDKMLMTGDAPQANPSAGGARPEIISNPTGAPLGVIPNPQSLQDVGYSKQAPTQSWQNALGGGMSMATPEPFQMARDARWIPPQAQPKQNPQTRDIRQVYDFMGRADKQWGRQPMMGNDMYKQRMLADYGLRNSSQGFATAPMGRTSINQQWAAPMQAQPIRRFALGTQEQYEATGNGSLYLPESNNQHLAGQELPDMMNILKDRGMPLGPGLVASATGGVAPTLNLGNAVTAGRKAGVLPSLQTLGRQTKSETEHTRGYFEGVGGVPWADIVDYLGKQTGHLKTAQVARGF